MYSFQYYSAFAGLRTLLVSVALLTGTLHAPRPCTNVALIVGPALEVLGRPTVHTVGHCGTICRLLYVTCLYFFSFNFFGRQLRNIPICMLRGCKVLEHVNTQPPAAAEREGPCMTLRSSNPEHSVCLQFPCSRVVPSNDGYEKKKKKIT